MAAAATGPPAGALEEVCRLAGSSARIWSVRELAGGQHAVTWRVETCEPVSTAVVRQFPPGDGAARSEVTVLEALDGLDGLAPVLLASDLDCRWSDRPTTVISWLEGDADIVPADPRSWAEQLGRALALLHRVPIERLAALPAELEQHSAAPGRLAGPLAGAVRAAWPRILACPQVLTHTDYWSGNVVWADGTLTGIVDWSGAGRGPLGYDLGWCRLDLVLLFDEALADRFLAAYERARGGPVDDLWLWDAWSLSRSQEIVDTWTPNYAPLGRPDLDAAELRLRHDRWTERLLARR